jgi:NADH:ubiquinone oxidoreductase subunit E
MVSDKIKEMVNSHKVISSFEYKPAELKMGYTNKTLRVDIGSGEISINEVTKEMKKLWTGGKGFDLWLTLQEINKNTKWDSPENPICMSSGPLGGTTSFPGSGKTLVTAVSPLTGGVMDSNVGGYFGPFLKFAGFDALTILGKASDDIVVLIDPAKGLITIELAPKESIDSHILAEELTEMYADDELDKRNIAVVSAGRGADHTRMGILNFSFYDWRRQAARLKQSGRGGIGTVFRNKKIKAMVIKNRPITPAWSIEESKVTSLTKPEKIHTQCLSEQDTIAEIVAKYDYDKEYVIEMMEDIQDRYRHISKSAIDVVSLLTKTPRAHLYHIATFYKTFSLEPKGETIIQVCMGTACHVKGAAKILDSFERNLGIKSGQTTKNKEYTLEAVACIGACSLAPVVKIGEEVFSKVKAGDIEKIMKTFDKKGGKTNV